LSVSSINIAAWKPSTLPEPRKVPATAAGVLTGVPTTVLPDAPTIASCPAGTDAMAVPAESCRACRNVRAHMPSSQPAHPELPGVRVMVSWLKRFGRCSELKSHS
jgi:hypothetical protein